jgi:hypothetical protein
VTEAELSELAPEELYLIPAELLSERAAFQPMTRFKPGGAAPGAAQVSHGRCPGAVI